MKEGDEEILNAVKAFNPYDLYSKADEKVEGVEALKVCVIPEEAGGMVMLTWRDSRITWSSLMSFFRRRWWNGEG